MISNTEQYYEINKIDDKSRDAALVELQEAEKNASAQTKIYGYITNGLLAVTTILASLLIENEATSIIESYSIYISIIIFFLGAFVLRYFVELQRQITFNARKVVTLRTMLGLNYSHIHLTLPEDRVEGASNPFRIKFFKGWLNFYSTPFWIVLIIVNILWWLVAFDGKLNLLLEECSFTTKFSYLLKPVYVNIIITILYIYIFRKGLNERHETTYLNIIKSLSKYIPRFSLVKEFEYVLYRAKLSIIELERLNVDYESMKPILVNIEDKRFYKHYGVSLKSLIRAVLSNYKSIRQKKGYLLSGGSTITMQLARTLFIPMQQNKYIRKCFEVLLALWLNGQFSKDEILNMYIASVRYERGVTGLAKAIPFFWKIKIKKKKLNNEESFFLIERLSNISSTMNKERIDHLKKECKANLNDDRLNSIYNDYIYKISQRQ